MTKNFFKTLVLTNKTKNGMKKIFFMWMLVFTAVVSFSSCSDDDSKVEYSLSPSEMALDYGDEKQIEVLPSLEGFEFSSDNSRIASVDIVGKVYANVAGETYINVVNTNANFVGKCKVTVTPTYSMFIDPCLNFGCSRSEVESYETREFGAEEGTSIAYRGENNDILMVMYTFTNDKLKAATLIFPYSSRVLDNLSTHLKQRYVTQVTGEGTVLMSADKKIGGLLDHFYEGGSHFSRVMLFPYKN